MEATIEATVAELNHRIDRIKSLLDDPRPGLQTWQTLLADELDAFTEYWRGK